MSCDSCMKSHDFLHFYKLQSCPIKITKEADEDVHNSSEVNVTQPESRNGVSTSEGEVDTTASSSTASAEQSCELERRRSLLSRCSEVTPGKATITESTVAGFFAESWRSQLCCCDSCKQLYTRSSLDFLLEESDPVGVYEGKAQRRPTTLDAGMAALSSSLDRVQQVEAFHREYPALVMGRQPPQNTHHTHTHTTTTMAGDLINMCNYSD